MARKKKIDKAKKKKIISILVIAAILLILVGCFIWYQYDKASKKSTITINDLNDDFIYLSQESYKENNLDRVYSFKYNLKDDYKMYVNYYKDNKKVDSGLLFIPFYSGKGTFYIKFRQLENEIEFDFFDIGEYINHYTPYPYSINNSTGYNCGTFENTNSISFDANEKPIKKIVLNNNKKQFIFGLVPYIEEYSGQNGTSSIGDPKNRIEIFIQKSND